MSIATPKHTNLTHLIHLWYTILIQEEWYMSKRMVLTLSDDLNKYLVEAGEKLGISKLEYIRYIIMKDKEGKK